ncbi:MAG: hydroxymethylglutaryl-CoA lyase [Candidatus Aminicenantia bacterium]
MIKEIIIHEVGLRDGIQPEKKLVPFEKKVEWAEKLMDSGIDIIQLGSFVNPEKVPQMADTDKLFNYFNSNRQKKPDVILSGLVLNEKGFERGMACGVEMFCMGVSASETHSMKNTGMSTEEALRRIIKIAKIAIESGKKIQASVQSAFGCGYEGPVNEEKVLSIVKEYLSAGIRNLSLADTAGHAIPSQIERLFSKIFELEKNIELACHFHNTYGLGLANCYTAFKVGVKYFESSFGGLGGCPFTKVPAGNVSTEDLVHTFQRMGIRKDINLDKLISISKDVSSFFGKELPGYIMKSGSLIELYEGVKNENS